MNINGKGTSYARQDTVLWLPNRTLIKYYVVVSESLKVCPCLGADWASFGGFPRCVVFLRAVLTGDLTFGCSGICLWATLLPYPLSNSLRLLWNGQFVQKYSIRISLQRKITMYFSFHLLLQLAYQNMSYQNVYNICESIIELFICLKYICIVIHYELIRTSIKLSLLLFIYLKNAL